MNIFSSNGRINRMQFLVWTLAIWAFITGLFFVLEWNAPYFAGALGEGLISLLMSKNVEGAIFVAIFFIIHLPPMFRRLHDVNQSSWPYWVSMWVPGGYIIALIYLLIRKGTRGANQFGDEPQFHWFGLDKIFVIFNSDDDVFYQQAYEEFENGQMDKGLWARLFAQSGGDENKAKAQYIKNRVQQLVTQQANLDTEKKRATPEQKRATQEKERKQEREREENIKRVEEAKKCFSEDASPKTEFIFICGDPDNEAARILLLNLNIKTLKELDVGRSVIKVGDMKTPAYFI